MIKYLAIAFLSFSCLAKNYIVEIADFNCKYCKEAEHYTHKLKLEAKLNGDEFVFAPVALSSGSKAEELLYYSVRHEPSMEKFIRKAMFDVKQTHRLKIESMDELIDFLEIYHKNSNLDIEGINAEIDKASNDFSNVKAYLKAEDLVQQHQIDSTPTFLIIDTQANVTVIEKPEKMVTSDYIDHVLDMYKRMSK